jgi:hypothetical protein
MANRPPLIFLNPTMHQTNSACKGTPAASQPAGSNDLDVEPCCRCTFLSLVIFFRTTIFVRFCLAWTLSPSRGKLKPTKVHERKQHIEKIKSHSPGSLLCRADCHAADSLPRCYRDSGGQIRLSCTVLVIGLQISKAKPKTQYMCAYQCAYTYVYIYTYLKWQVNGWELRLTSGAA